MKLSRIIPWAVFTGVAALILGPLLAPGYVLTLDLSWGPHLPLPDWSNNSEPLVASVWLLGRVLPAWVVEKLVLLGIFTLAGVGLWRLARREVQGWPAYAAGALYMVNPFTYERLMAGQWQVLLGYALLPWVAGALMRLLERPGPARAVELAAWGAALAVAGVHLVAMAALAAAALTAAWGLQHRAKLKAAWRWLALAAGLWLAAAAWWLVPLVLGRTPAALAIGGFDWNQFLAFRTAAGPLGAPVNALVLQGFWGERTGVVVPPSSVGPGWWVVAAVVLALVAAGAVLGYRRRDPVALGLAAAGAVAWVLAIGVAWLPSGLLTHALVAVLPAFRGYREPAKWLALLALAYAYLAALSLQAVARRFKAPGRPLLAAASATLIFAFTPALLWGAAGQLTSAQYPQTWPALNARLSALPAAPAGHPDTVVFPWHEYTFIDFARRPVAGVPQSYFDRPVITSNDPEFPGVTPPAGQSLASQIQNNVINRRYFEHNAGSRLAALGVHYVVVLKVSNWHDYGWVSTQDRLKLIAETADWQLFQVSQ